MSNTPSMTEHVTGVLPVQSDLKSRLELLERSLKDMETRAATHLGRRLEGTLTSALQITNIPCAILSSPVEAITVDQEQEVDYFSNLDTSTTTTDTPKLEQEEKEVNRTTQQQQDITNTQQLELSNNDTEEMMYQIVAHVENELGEAIRRCEKKVELVTEIINEDLLSFIEDRLATRTVALEKRMEELEARLEQQSAAAAMVVVPVKEEEEKKKEEEAEEESVPAAVISVAPEQEKEATAGTPPPPPPLAPHKQDDKEVDEEKVQNNNAAKSMPVHVTEPISRMPTPPAKAPPSKPMSRLADPARSSIAKISPSPKKNPTQLQQITPRASQASSATIKALQEAKAKIAQKQQARMKEEIAKQEAEDTNLGSMLLKSIMMMFMFALAAVFVAVGALSVLVLQGHVKAEDLGDFGGLLEWNFH